MTTPRVEVYQAIDTERNYQDSVWPQDGDEGQLSIGEYILMIEEYVSKARAEWVTEQEPEIRALNVIRKIAGITVKCMEEHGAPHREGT